VPKDQAEVEAEAETHYRPDPDFSPAPEHDARRFDTTGITIISSMMDVGLYPALTEAGNMGGVHLSPLPLVAGEVN
jgi:hypothetical protein